jgi:holo-[acyl-carrier protein] synthase
MIRGIGVDIIEVERIAQVLCRRGDRFINKLFTAREQLIKADVSENRLAEHYAGKFAAKEAVVKAFGTGFSGVDWKDVEILKDDKGKPVVLLSKELEERFGFPELLVTITHSRKYACAFCVWQTR